MNLRPAGRARVHRRLVFGGVDSMLLAALAHRYVPPGRAVDLINVCFDGGRSPDRAAALDGAAELDALFPTRAWRLVRVDADVDEVRRGLPAARLAGLLRPARTVMDRNIGAALWLAARGGRLDRCRVGAGGEQPPNAVREQPRAARRRRRRRRRRRPDPYASRARVLLLGQGADEQCAGYSRHRAAFRAGSVIRRGHTCVSKEDGPAEGLSPARDWEALGGAVRLDATRLWRRNMGRDDRLVSDRGREARFPFLDEGVAARLLATPLCDVADLSGHEGDKLLVRAAARPFRHAPRGGARAKRAIPGSRVSKSLTSSDARVAARRAARARDRFRRPGPTRRRVGARKARRAVACGARLNVRIKTSHRLRVVRRRRRLRRRRGFQFGAFFLSELSLLPIGTLGLHGSLRSGRGFLRRVLVGCLALLSRYPLILVLEHRCLFFNDAVLHRHLTRSSLDLFLIVTFFENPTRVGAGALRVFRTTGPVTRAKSSLHRPRHPSDHRLTSFVSRPSLTYSFHHEQANTSSRTWFYLPPVDCTTSKSARDH